VTRVENEVDEKGAGECDGTSHGILWRRRMNVKKVSSGRRSLSCSSTKLTVDLLIDCSPV
jgi:hypothetical protein